ncbi:MAG: ABC transporter ATP-binding protein [Caldilineaceae bacterium]
MSLAIEIEQLSKSYPKRNGPPVQAVIDLNLTVPAGQVIGFLGANGAGKTTTIKMLCGLILPDAGQVKLNGHAVRQQRSAAMRQIGAVLEGTRNVYWRLSAWQNLLYFGRLKGAHGQTLRTRAEKLLHELELWTRRHDPVREFSRGMQQKVAIACALIADPPIVLLDEPTLGLDVQAARTVKRWIRQLSSEQGKTVVLTTHQLDMAQELCDRVAIMRQGRLIADQPTTELLGLFRQEYYQIRVAGEVDGQQPVLNGFTHAHENGETVFSGALGDSVNLYQVLDRLRDLGLPLLAVQKAEPNLEEVFLHLTEAER